MNQDNMNNSVNGSPVNSTPPVGGMSFVTGDVSNNVTPQQAPVQPVATNSAPVSVSQPVVSEPVVSRPEIVSVQPMPEANSEPVSPPVVNLAAVVNEQPASQIVNESAVNSINTNPQEQVQPQVNQEVANVQPVQSVNGLNTIGPVEQPAYAENTEVNVPDVLEQPAAKKKLNPIVIVLIVILLTVIGVSLGILLFNKFGNKPGNEETTTDTPNVASVNLNNNVINNVNVDADKLKEVLALVGIASTTDVVNNTNLNYYVSNNKYMDNIKEIIVSYAVNADGNTNSEITYPEDYDRKSDIGACSATVSCALISKVDAENVLKRYNLGTDLTKYFYKSSEIDDVYGIHFGGTLVLDIFNSGEAGITHNLSAEMADNNDININDTQVVSTVSEDGSIQSNNRTVNYNFKLSSDNIYYLASVSVTE